MLRHSRPSRGFRPAFTLVELLVVSVTFKGQPVKGADIVFVPSTPEALAAFAKTGADGKFEMRTFEPGDGVVADTY